MWWITSTLAATWQVPAQFSTIQEAFDDSAVVNDDVIVVGAGTFDGAVLTNGKVLTLRGEGFTTTLNPANAGEAVLDVQGSTLLVEDLSMDALTSGPVVAIAGSSNVTLRAVAFVNGADTLAEAGGACLNVSASTVLIEDGVFTGCTASNGSGGAVRARSGTALTFRDSTLSANSTLGSGGALKVDLGATAVLDNVDFADNDAGVAGGAISVDGTLTATGGIFTRNDATTDGGAISVAQPTSVASFDGSVFEENVAVGNGGAIAAAGQTTLDRVRLEINDAEQGGGVYIDGTFTARNLFSCGNEAMGGTGHSLFYASGTADVANLLSVDNGTGSGIGSTLSGTLRNSTIYNESADPFVAAEAGTFADNVVVTDAGTAVGIDLDGPVGTPPDVTNNILFGVGLDIAADPADNLSDDPGLSVMGSTCAGYFAIHATQNVNDNGSLSLDDTDGTPANLGHLGGPEADGAWWGADADGDGSFLGGDCDDNEPAAYPTATEICDAIDNDCDTFVDDADADLAAAVYYFDADGDGYAENTASPAVFCNPPPEYVARLGDCDDTNITVHAGAIEACPDGIDNDCDMLVDTADADYTPNAQLMWVDNDSDGVGVDDASAVTVCSDAQPVGFVPASAGEDCDDTNSLMSPILVEVCDEFDNNCDGQINEGFLSSPYYPDLDGDGFGNPTGVELSCSPIPGMVVNDEDCDDADPNINPSIAEICDDIDQNCDGTADDGLPTQTWYVDLDGDGFGDENDPGTPDCDALLGHSLNADDCDDADATTNPNGTEIIDDGIDNDCDGVDETTPVIDSDGDGIPDDIDPNPNGLGDLTGLPPKATPGCSCSTGSSSTFAWVGLLALAMIRRRRG